MSENDNSLTVVEWCGICNAREAAGTLFVVEPGGSDQIPIPACLPCVAQMPMSQWMEGKRVIKEKPDE